MRCTMLFTTMRVCWVARCTSPSRESADGSTEYWMAAEAQSPLVRYSRATSGIHSGPVVARRTKLAGSGWPERPDQRP